MSAHDPAGVTVHQAWAAVMAEVKAVGKDGRNQQQSYNFRGIDGVMNAVGPAMRKHGVVVLPSLRSRETGTVEVGQKRTPMAHVVVEVDFTVYGPAGDTITGSTPGEAMDSGDKATSKAMSVAYRTFLIQALTLPTHEVDPDESTYERSAPELTRPVERHKGNPGEDQWQTPDPLKAVKAEVWAAAQAVGITDAATLGAHFATATGLVLADANEEALRAYLDVLREVAV